LPVVAPLRLTLAQGSSLGSSLIYLETNSMNWSKVISRVSFQLEVLYRKDLLTNQDYYTLLHDQRQAFSLISVGHMTPLKLALERTF